MKNSIFIGNLLEEVGNLMSVNSFNCQFEEYTFEEFNGFKFIKGKGRPENPYTKDNFFDGPSLLFSLINLVKEPLPRFFDDLDEVLLDEDILNWVKKYGIPYQDGKLNEINKDKIHRIDILYLYSFKYKLAWLYSSFSLWNAIFYEDNEEIIKFDYVTKLNLKIKKTVFKNRELHNGIDLIKEALAETIDQKTNVSIHFEYNLNTKAYEYNLKSDSLFSIAYYQLSSLMSKKYNETKKKMKKCSYCNSIYWAKHANSKYCSNCDRRTIWSRENKKLSDS